MSPLDIAITGVGVTTPLGHDLPAIAEALSAGQSALAVDPALADAPFPARLTARVSNFKARDHVDNRKNLKLMSFATTYGLAAVKRAAADAGERPEDPARYGIFVGAGTALGDARDLMPAIQKGVGEEGFELERFATQGVPLINPLWLLKGLSNNVLGFASASLDAQGINQNYCHDGAGGLIAVGEAAWALAEGRADRLIAGGADALILPGHLSGYGRLGLLMGGEDPARLTPLGEGASGLVAGEGAAFVTLETLEAARARGARVIARVRGYGAAASAGEPPTLDAEAVAAAGRRALEVAGWRPEDVEVCVLTGSGVPALDAGEALGAAQLFGPHRPPVTSLSTAVGYTGAAHGAISLAAGLAAMTGAGLPAGPTAPRAEATDLNLHSGGPLSPAPTRLLIHSAGLGGQTAWLAVEAP